MVETTQDIHESIQQLLIRASLQATLASQQFSTIQIQNPITLKSPFLASPSKPKLPSSYPIKRLTYSEMQQLRDQGLCLNCKDLDTPSHRCPIKKIILVIPDEDANIKQQSAEIFELDSEEIVGQQVSSYAIHALELQPVSKQDVTFHELPGFLDPKALRFRATIFTSSVATLIDTCISQQYMHLKLAQFLSLLFDHSSALFITVRNGKKMRSKECTKMLSDSKIYIFDPGGMFYIGSIFDLEDKVDLKGTVMIRMFLMSRYLNLHVTWTRSIGCSFENYSRRSILANASRH